MRTRLCAILVLAVLQATALAQETEKQKYVGTPEENEFLELIDALYKQYDAYYAEAQRIQDEDKRSEHYERGDPGHEFVPKLLSLEERHPKTLAGLMALRQVLRMAAGGGGLENPRDLGRREALKRLGAYAHQSVLADMLRLLDGGSYEPAVEAFLRSLAKSADADATVRVFSELTLAEWMLDTRDEHEYLSRRAEELRNGDKPAWVSEEQDMAKRLESLPQQPQLRRWEDEAVAILQKLCTSGQEYRQPAIEKIDPDWRLVRVDVERTKSMPRISELAEGVLFKESHLREGKPAPDLKLTLLSGDDWSLAEQTGRAVIIQFSFKGCGPCEEMYGDFRKLPEEHGERLSILSIMTDEKREDTVQAVNEEKLTWSITWDGDDGPLKTRWGVRGFPTVYVINPEGKIAGESLRGERLKTKVAEMLK